MQSIKNFEQMVDKRFIRMSAAVLCVVHVQAQDERVGAEGVQFDNNCYNGEWIEGRLSNFGDYNGLNGHDVSCSDCAGCQNLPDGCLDPAQCLVGNNPCITAAGGARSGHAGPLCSGENCYAIRCRGEYGTHGVTCKDGPQEVIVVKVVDKLGNVDQPKPDPDPSLWPSGTQCDDAHVFDLNDQAFFEIFNGVNGVGGNVLIEYKKVCCSKWNASAEVDGGSCLLQN